MHTSESLAGDSDEDERILNAPIHLSKIIQINLATAINRFKFEKKLI